MLQAVPPKQSFLSVLLDEAQQVFHCLALGDGFLYAGFLLVERNLAGTGTYITVVGVSHFAGTVDNATHDAYLQTLHVGSRCLYLGDGGAEVVERATATGT